MKAEGRNSNKRMRITSFMAPRARGLNDVPHPMPRCRVPSTGLRAVSQRYLAYPNGRIWTPPQLPALRFFVRRGTTAHVYPALIVDLDQPRSGHDGLFARQRPIALSGLMPAAIPGFCWRRFDLFAIDQSARNRGDSPPSAQGACAMPPDHSVRRRCHASASPRPPAPSCSLAL